MSIETGSNTPVETTPVVTAPVVETSAAASASSAVPPSQPNTNNNDDGFWSTTQKETTPAVVSPVTPTATVPPPSPSQTPIAVTTDTLAAAFKAAFPQQQQVQQQVATAPLTQAEIDAKFNVVRLNPDIISELGLDATNPKVVATLENLLHGAAKMAHSIAAYQLDQRFQLLTSQLAPLQQAHQDVAREKLVNDFFTEHPAMKDEAYQPILLMCEQELAKSNFQGTKKEAFAKVAEMATQVMTKVRGGQSPVTSAAPVTTGNIQQLSSVPPSQQNNQQQSGQQTTHRMSTLQGGGQGGAGGMPAGQQEKSLGASVWS